MNRLSHKILLLVAMMVAATLGCSALSTSYYAASSKLASGKWVKIKVSETGMQQVTYDQLREWGFSNPERVSVYGNGGSSLNSHKFENTVPDDIRQTASVHTADGRLLFYGNAGTNIRIVSTGTIQVTRNYSSFDGYYLLSDSENPQAISTNSVTARATVYDTHLHFNYTKHEVQNPARAGSFFFGPSLTDGIAQKQSFAMRDFASDGVHTAAENYLKNGYFRYGFNAKAAKRQTLTVKYPEDWDILTNVNSAVDACTGDVEYYNSASGYCSFEPSEDNPTLDGDFDVSISLNPLSTITFAALDYCYLYYPRFNRIYDEPELDMYFPFGRTSVNFRITEAPDNIVVWNVTDINNITGFSSSYDRINREYICSFDATYNSSSAVGAGHFIAFNTSKQHRSVEFVGQVANQNIHGTPTPDMVIITNNALYDEACDLADTHRTIQGLDVKVYRQDEVFNEFSYGTPHVMGYRRMLKMMYDRNPEKIKYLLLYGPGSWDNRGIVVPQDDRLLTFQTDIVSCAKVEPRAFTSDVYFGMLNDSYVHTKNYNEPAQIAVGRIAASKVHEARQTNEKIKNFMANPPSASFYNNVLLISDDGDENAHFKQSCSLDSILTLMNPNIATTTAHNLVFPWQDKSAYVVRNVITKALKKGAGFFSYTGHGSHIGFGSENLWSKALIENTDYTYPTFAMLSTCDTYAFDRLDDGMAETATYKQNGGMIGLIGACRSVYLIYNPILNLEVAKAYANVKPGMTYGDIFRIAHNNARTLPENTSLEKAVNTMCYNFAGDPAVPVPVPNYNITFNTINSQNAGDFAEPLSRSESDGEGESSSIFSIHLNPLVPFEITGSITDASGTVVTDFNGEAEITIYDGPQTVQTTIKDGSAITDKNCVLNFKYDQDVLSTAKAKVVNGTFTATMTLPVPQMPLVSNRMHAAAKSQDNTLAAGNFKYLTVTDFDSQLVDDETLQSHPVITEMYLDTPDFTNGGTVASTTTLHATIQPSATGINFSTSGIGASATLMLDNSKSYSEVASVMSIMEDGNISIELPISNITNGMHSLTLNVADNAGNRTSRSIDFMCMTYPTVNTLEVEEMPAVTSATFDLQHSFDNTPETRLVIEDAQGNLVATVNNPAFPFSWDLKDSSGNTVPNGKYNAHVIIRDAATFTHGSTPMTQFVVLKPID